MLGDFYLRDRSSSGVALLLVFDNEAFLSVAK